MNTSHIRSALQDANLAEASRQTGISVRRLFQLRDIPDNKPLTVTLSTYAALDKWAKARPKGERAKQC